MLTGRCCRLHPQRVRERGLQVPGRVGAGSLGGGVTPDVPGLRPSDGAAGRAVGPDRVPGEIRWPANL